MMYVLGGMLIGATAGLFIGAAFTKPLSGVKRCVTMILIAIAFGIFWAFMSYTRHIGNEKLWNNGICVACGGKMEFISASHNYYYKCNDCGNVIELDHLYN